MSPEQRKTASEFELHKRGIRINLGLPTIESNDEVELRPAAALLGRLLALWAVAGAAGGENQRMRAYCAAHPQALALSAQERDFLSAETVSEAACQQFASRRESLYFLCWCAGLVESIEVTPQASDLQAILGLFPQQMEAPARLQAALRMRSKNAVLSWADLLYRLHWAMRHAHLIGKPAPANLSATLVQQWHQAANWMIRYDDEDDWDRVATDT